MLMRNIFLLLSFHIGSLTAFQCDVPGECVIMAIGGEISDDLAIDDVELVSLDPILHPIPDCLSQLNPLPEVTKYAAGSLDYTSMLASYSYPSIFQNDRVDNSASPSSLFLNMLRNVKHFFAEGGSPFVCGGASSGQVSDIRDYCYAYTAALDEWVISGTMAEGRVLSAYASSEWWGLVMAGGYQLANVATTSDGDSFGSLPDLPLNRQSSCLVIIDDDRLFICGGFQGYNEALIFSKSTNSWST